MRALRIHEHGDTRVLCLEDLPLPQAGPGQVRIKVVWAALNHLDLWVRCGVPGHRFPLPLTPGCDFSGVVDQPGVGAEQWTAGTRVTVAPGFSCGGCRACGSGQHNLCRRYGIYGETCDGGNAEYAVVDAANLIEVPAAFTLESAAAFPLTYLTAWHMLVTRCAVRPGDRVLVHAAGSGVSVAAVQIARLHGAEVMVTAGSDAKVAMGLDNGAALGVNYRDQDWTEAARDWSGRAGLDIIVDHVGADTLPQGVWALAKGGRIVTCGVTSGAQMEIPFAPVFFKSLSILGSTMGGLGEMKHVSELVFSGKLSPVIDSRFPWAEVADAHRRMEERSSFGKILLQIDPSQA